MFSLTQNRNTYTNSEGRSYEFKDIKETLDGTPITTACDITVKYKITPNNPVTFPIKIGQSVYTDVFDHILTKLVSQWNIPNSVFKNIVTAKLLTTDLSQMDAETMNKHKEDIRNTLPNIKFLNSVKPITGDIKTEGVNEYFVNDLFGNLRLPLSKYNIEFIEPNDGSEIVHNTTIDLTDVSIDCIFTPTSKEEFFFIFKLVKSKQSKDFLDLLSKFKLDIKPDTLSFSVDGNKKNLNDGEDIIKFYIAVNEGTSAFDRSNINRNLRDIFALDIIKSIFKDI